MSTIPISAAQVSVEDYLDGEIRSTVKHDYLGGIVYADHRIEGVVGHEKCVSGRWINAGAGSEAAKFGP